VTQHKVEQRRTISIAKPAPAPRNTTPAPKTTAQTTPARSTAAVPPAHSPTPAKPRTLPATYQAVNNNFDGECSIEACAAVEDWLMKWYNQYNQYSPVEKRASKFLAALKDTKDIYDKQKMEYPKKLRFLLRKFDMLPYQF
jgi:hypothetical protein